MYNHSEFVKSMFVIYISYEVFTEMIICGSRVKYFL